MAKVHWRRLAIVEDKDEIKKKEENKKVNKENKKKIHWRRLPIID